MQCDCVFCRSPVPEPKKHPITVLFQHRTNPRVHFWAYASEAYKPHMPNKHNSRKDMFRAWVVPSPEGHIRRSASELVEKCAAENPNEELRIHDATLDDFSILVKADANHNLKPYDEVRGFFKLDGNEAYMPRTHSGDAVTESAYSHREPNAVATLRTTTPKLPSKRRAVAPRNERGTRRCMSAADAERPFEIVNRPAVGPPSQPGEHVFGAPLAYVLVANVPENQTTLDDIMRTNPVWDGDVVDEVMRYANPIIHEVVAISKQQPGRAHETICTVVQPNGSLVRNVTVSSAFVYLHYPHLAHLYHRRKGAP